MATSDWAKARLFPPASLTDGLLVSVSSRRRYRPECAGDARIELCGESGGRVGGTVGLVHSGEGPGFLSATAGSGNRGGVMAESGGLLGIVCQRDHFGRLLVCALAGVAAARDGRLVAGSVPSGAAARAGAGLPRLVAATAAGIGAFPGRARMDGALRQQTSFQRRPGAQGRPQQKYWPKSGAPRSTPLCGHQDLSGYKASHPADGGQSASIGWRNRGEVFGLGNLLTSAPIAGRVSFIRNTVRKRWPQF